MLYINLNSKIINPAQVNTETYAMQTTTCDIDTLPLEQDFTDSATMGLLDAQDDIYNPPHWSNAANFDAYLTAWNDQWARENGVTLWR